MSDPEKTDINWKARGAAALAWAKLHPTITGTTLGFLFGFLLGAVAF